MTPFTILTHIEKLRNTAHEIGHLIMPRSNAGGVHSIAGLMREGWTVGTPVTYDTERLVVEDWKDVSR